MSAITKTESIVKHEYESSLKELNTLLLSHTTLPRVLVEIIVKDYVFDKEEFELKFKLLVQIDTIESLFEKRNELTNKYFSQQSLFRSGKESKGKLKERRAVSVKYVAISSQNTENNQAIATHISEMDRLCKDHIGFGFSETSIVDKVKKIKEQQNGPSDKDDEKSNPDIDNSKDI